jgi:4-alpha-glucanotransferase
MLVAIQLDDLIGETEPVNIPGTHREYPNWRRKLMLPLEAIFDDARWPRLAEIMREAGRSGRSSPA